MSEKNTLKDSSLADRLKDNIPIWVILMLSAFLNLWNIWGQGFANKYYAAGVYSMGQNFHAFFFNSFDSVGFITIDKPPLGFWIQVLFTKVFGFGGTVLILPQAIAAVISVYLIYRIIKKRFSKSAGLISAAVLALTPIFVAVSRNNTIDGILILLLVLAAEQALIAVEKASAKHLILAGVFIGLGFNVKMLQAYVIVPAIYLTYLIFAKQKFFKKILVSALAFIIMAIISLSWVAAVDLTSETQRPYVGSSEDNSAIDLAIGYNGISRIINTRTFSDDKKPKTPLYVQNTDSANQRSLPDNPNLPNNQPQNPQDIKPPLNNIPASGNPGETGEPGIFRLFNKQNAGQTGWFIVPAIFAVVLMLVLIIKGRFKSNPQNIALLFFALSFVPIFIYFSFQSGIFHRYYFATMAPFIAGLIGIGYYHLFNEEKYWIPIVFIHSAGAQLYIQSLYKGWFDWLQVVSALVLGVAATVLIAMPHKLKKLWIGLLLCTLFLLPAIWSATPMLYSDNSQLPAAGPELAVQNDKLDRQLDLSNLIEYLEKEREGAAYLAMTPSSMDIGAELILQSGEAVMALGGFNGGDTPLTLAEFISMVEQGEVRYAITSGNDKKANDEIYRWITENADIVRPKRYGGIIRNIKLYKFG